MIETTILDDRAVSEIEAWLKQWTMASGTYPATWNQARALCATVKHLRNELERGALCEECDQWEYNEDGSVRTFMVCGACWNAVQSQVEQLRAENGRLREQVVEAEKAAERWFNRRY